MKKGIVLNYKKIINVILILNLIDLVLTYVGLEAGYFIEGNFLMDNLYNFNKISFVLVKVIAISFFGYTCHKYYYKISLNIKRLLIIPLIVYSYVTILHLLVLIMIFK